MSTEMGTCHVVICADDRMIAHGFRSSLKLCGGDEPFAAASGGLAREMLSNWNPIKKTVFRISFEAK